MKMKHVNDHDIQQFAFDLSECKTEIIEHISLCKVCKMKVESYQSLSSVVKNQPDPIVEFNLSELVLEQLEIAPKKKPIYSSFIYFLIILSIGIILISLYHFNGIFINLLDSSAITPAYFLISIVVLISFALGLDMVRSFNKKINMLNY